MPSVNKPDQPRRRPRKRARRQSRRTESSLSIIDRLLMMPIKISQNGKPAKISALAAIMHRLLQAEIDGNARATKVLRRYRQLVRHIEEKSPEIVFADNSHSWTSTNGKPGDGDA